VAILLHLEVVLVSWFMHNENLTASRLRMELLSISLRAVLAID